MIRAILPSDICVQMYNRPLEVSNTDMLCYGLSNVVNEWTANEKLQARPIGY